MRAWRAETVYVVGGLYGNRFALEAIRSRAQRESREVILVFNGDSTGSTSIQKSS